MKLSEIHLVTAILIRTHTNQEFNRKVFKANEVEGLYYDAETGFAVVNGDTLVPRENIAKMVLSEPYKFNKASKKPKE